MKGYTYYVDDDRIAAYRSVSIDRRIRWVEENARAMYSLASPETRARWRALRAGGSIDDAEVGATEIVVLGLWAPEQRRIELVHLLRRELRLGLPAALELLNANLERGAPIVVEIAPADRARAVAAEIAALGAEVRLLSGCRRASSRARDEHDAIVRELDDLHRRSFPDRDALLAAVRLVCPAGRVASEPR